MYSNFIRKFKRYRQKHKNQTKGLEKIYKQYFGYKENGFFIEIGVGPSMNAESNTSFLADIGWQGIYIEPNPVYYAECLERHKKNRVKVFNIALGNEDRIVTLQGDTLVPRHRFVFDSLGWYREANLEEYTVTEADTKHFFSSLDIPSSYDLLSIDVEGYEYNIISRYPFDLFRPKLIVIELRHNHPRFKAYPDIIEESLKTLHLIQDNCYKVVKEDILNTILVSLA